jgi:hypothetical protein
LGDERELLRPVYGALAAFLELVRIAATLTYLIRRVGPSELWRRKDTAVRLQKQMFSSSEK